MYGYPYYYNSYPYPTHHPTNFFHYPQQRVYPPVDIQQFSSSIQSFRFLMNQATILLDKLADKSLEKKIMSAAQEGNKEAVNKIINSIGLKVPVTTQYTPSGIKFILQTKPSQNTLSSCCSLTISLQWGN